jgi:hypothetical protein
MGAWRLDNAFNNDFASGYAHIGAIRVFLMRR